MEDVGEGIEKLAEGLWGKVSLVDGAKAAVSWLLSCAHTLALVLMGILLEFCVRAQSGRELQSPLLVGYVFSGATFAVTPALLALVGIGLIFDLGHRLHCAYLAVRRVQVVFACHVVGTALMGAMRGNKGDLLVRLMWRAAVLALGVINVVTVASPLVRVAVSDGGKGDAGVYAF